MDELNHDYEKKTWDAFVHSRLWEKATFDKKIRPFVRRCEAVHMSS